MGEFEVYLQGGPPWGFRLQGGREFRMPIRIAKVEPSGKAHNGGVQVGDQVTEIEEVSTANMYHTEALSAVKKAQYSLSLLLTRPEKKVEKSPSPIPSDSNPEISKTKVSVVIGPKRSVSSERLSSDDEGRGRSTVPQGQTYMKKLMRNQTAEADFPRPMRSKSLSRNAQPDSGNTSPRSDYSSNSLPRNLQNGHAHSDYSSKSLPRTRTKSTTDVNSKAPSWYKDMYKEMNTSMEKESLLTKLLASDAIKGAFRKYDGATSPFDRSTEDVQKAATFEDVPRRLRRDGDGRSIANHPNRKSLPNLHAASFNFADHNNSNAKLTVKSGTAGDGHDWYRHIQKGGNIPETGLASKSRSPKTAPKWETMITPPSKPISPQPTPEPIKSKNISIEYNNPPDFLELRKQEIKNKELEEEREEIRNKREQERLSEEQRLLEQRSRDLKRIEEEKRRLELKEEELKQKEKLLIRQQSEHEERRVQDDLRRKEKEEMRLLKLKEEELQRKEEMLLKQERELEELKQMKLREEKQRQEEEEQLLKQLLEEEEQKRRDADELQKQREFQKREEEDKRRLRELEEKRKQREEEEEIERLQKLKEKEERLQKLRQEEERLQRLKEEELRQQRIREDEERRRQEEEAELERQRIQKLKEEEAERETLRMLEEERERLRQLEEERKRRRQLEEEEEQRRIQEEEEEARRILQLKEEELRKKEEELLRIEAEQLEQERLLDESLNAPPLPLYGLAKYSFHPQNEGELKFKKGSLISIIEAVDENWIEGEFNGNIGIFPISYVELLDHKPGEEPPKPKPKPKVVQEEGGLDAKYMEPSGTLLVNDAPVEEAEVIPSPEVPVENGLPHSEQDSSENAMALEDLETTPEEDVKDVDIIDIAAAVKADIEPGLAYARYAFRAETDAELSFSKGVEIVLLKRVDDNWYEGEINGKIGILPVNYVRVEREPVLNEPPTPEPEPELEPEPEPIVAAEPISLADIVTEPTPEKILKPTDERDRRTSAEMILDEALTAHEQNKKAKENGPLPCNGINGHDEPVNGDPALDDFIGQGEPYKAIYKFSSSNEDEIELQVGDVVNVLEKCDDNWFIGTSERTGAFGTFPGNYVVPL